MFHGEKNFWGWVALSHSPTHQVKFYTKNLLNKSKPLINNNIVFKSLDDIP